MLFILFTSTRSSTTLHLGLLLMLDLTVGYNAFWCNLQSGSLTYSHCPVHIPLMHVFCAKPNEEVWTQVSTFW